METGISDTVLVEKGTVHTFFGFSRYKSTREIAENIPMTVV